MHRDPLRDNPEILKILNLISKLTGALNLIIYVKRADWCENYLSIPYWLRKSLVIITNKSNSLASCEIYSYILFLENVIHLCANECWMWKHYELICKARFCLHKQLTTTWGKYSPDGTDSRMKYTVSRYETPNLVNFIKIFIKYDFILFRRSWGDFVKFTNVITFQRPKFTIWANITNLKNCLNIKN